MQLRSGCCGSVERQLTLLLLLLLPQDTLVLSGVIATCLVFTLIYIFSK